MKLLPLPSGGASIFKFRRSIHRPVTLHGDTAGSRGICSLLLDSSQKTRTRIYGCFIDAVFLTISAKSSPLNRLFSIFETNRFVHRPVTLHGDTAGSRGVCLLLQDFSRKTRTRIYGCLIDAVFLIISTKSSPLLNGLISIFEISRFVHRPVTLHGDTAGSRGVCLLLLLWASTQHTQLLLRLMI